MEIKGLVALVTGAASGLGLATTRWLVGGGARVVMFDQADEGEALAGALGENASFVQGDVTSEEDVLRAIARSQKFGHLECAVTCAGIGGGGRALRRDGPMPMADFERIIAVNLFGTFNVQRLAAQAMVEAEPRSDAERGVMIATASIAAYEGRIGQAAYAASKGGVVALTLPMARELGARQIRVATIAPGIFDTPLLGRLSDEVRATLAAEVPHPQQIGDPRHFAALVAHIIENPMINGEVIRLDGALRMSPR